MATVARQRLARLLPDHVHAEQAGECGLEPAPHRWSSVIPDQAAELLLRGKVKRPQHAHDLTLDIGACGIRYQSGHVRSSVVMLRRSTRRRAWRKPHKR